MATLPTLPTRSRLERLSIAAAVAVVGIGLIGLGGNGWILDRMAGDTVPVQVYPEEALCFVLLGMALFARDFRWRSIEWLAVLPAALGLVKIGEDISNREFRLDALLSIGPSEFGNHYLRFAPMTAVCLILAGASASWHAAKPRASLRRLMEAASGSVLAAIGCATLFGYLASLIDVAKWGTSTPIPPSTALALLLIGLTMLAQGWQESIRSTGEPPSWAPLPIAAWGLTLTLILWADLRQHEAQNLSQQTLTQMDVVAIDTNTLIAQQAAMVQRVAQTWVDPEEKRIELWKLDDAQPHVPDMQDTGAVSLSFVTLSSLRAVKTIFADGETAYTGQEHGKDEARKDAIHRALTQSEGWAVTGTVEIPNARARTLGYAIYAVVRNKDGKPLGYAVEEFPYSLVFSKIVHKRDTQESRLVDQYRISVSIRFENVFQTTVAPKAGGLLTFERDYTPKPFDGRVYLTFEPAADLVAQGRPLQQSVLVAGLVLSILMGLALQQALRARSGQRLAERTNYRLRSEIDERRRIEIQLKHAKFEAEAGSRAKSEFLASMSHEIRTPMNGVIGMASLLMDTKLTPEQRDYVNTIRASGDALLTIINEILDFSKIESGKMEIEHHPFELAPCIEETIDLFGMQAAAKRLELGCYVAPEVPHWIVGDVTRLRQVVANLVNNAIKFTPSGSVSVEVRRGTMPPPKPKPDADEDLEAHEGLAPAVKPSPLDPAHNPRLFALEVSVRDTGIGIPPDRMDRLFKAFSQVDSSTTRKYGGTGLGLAICQRLSELMGGGIRVESAPAKGSAFIFTILTEPSTDSAQESATPVPVALVGGTVLCVEDLPVNQARLKAFFEGWGCHCVVAADLKAAQALVATHKVAPSLLVVDDDGSANPSPWQVLEALGCPRLVLFPFGQTAPAAPRSGPPFDALAKPIKNGLLANSVAGLFGPRRIDTAAAAEGVSSRLLAEEFPIEVLLAEDNAVNQKVALRFLERLGYRADVANNGREALNLVELRHYDLVLMDMQMPDMDGLESSRQIRRRLPRDRQPVIIALTANAMKGDREVCLAAGMDDHISKPVKMDEIAAAVRRHFGKKGTAIREAAKRG